MIHKEILKFVAKDETVEIVRNDTNWLQLVKSEKTSPNSIIDFCSKFDGVNVVNTEDYIHIMTR